MIVEMSLNQYEQMMSDACDKMVALQEQLKQRDARIAELEKFLGFGVTCATRLMEQSRDTNNPLFIASFDAVRALLNNLGEGKDHSKDHHA